MGRLIDVLLRALTRKGLRRGLGGEHWAWLLIAGAAYVFERARHPDDRTERIDLRPGDRYLVTLQPRIRHRRRPGRAGSSDTTGTAAGPEDAYQPQPTTG